MYSTVRTVYCTSALRVHYTLDTVFQHQIHKHAVCTTYHVALWQDKNLSDLAMSAKSQLLQQWQACADMYADAQSDLGLLADISRLAAGGLWQVYHESKGIQLPEVPCPRYAEIFAVLAGREQHEGPPGITTTLQMGEAEDQARWLDGDWARYWLSLGQYRSAEQVAGWGSAARTVGDLTFE